MNGVKTILSVIATGLGAWLLLDTTRRVLQHNRKLRQVTQARLATQSWENEGGAPLKLPTK